MTVMPNPSLPTLSEKTARLRDWLENRALPLWWETGAGHPDMGFYERIGQDGQPMVEDDRRARVQPRQAYCYAAAGRAGWKGPWKEAVEHALFWFDGTYLMRSGLYGSLADMRGRLIDPTFDLYNQAFALLAGASVASAMPEKASEARKRAETILGILRSDYAHPKGGFETDIPRRQPLCSNPHMHMFEAALAWEEIPGAGSEIWHRLSDEIANLAMTFFIDAETGGVREFFDLDWQPMPDAQGRILEPGHQFEWAWLLCRWGALRHNQEALAKAKRMFEIGESHGICPRRAVAIMQIDTDFKNVDAMARLWPQTEWLKAAVLLASLSEGNERNRYLASVDRALDALSPFLATPIEGLWYDKWPEDGPMRDEPAPASSFYHIVCAIYEADRLLAAMTV